METTQRQLTIIDTDINMDENCTCEDERECEHSIHLDLEEQENDHRMSPNITRERHSRIVKENESLKHALSILQRQQKVLLQELHKANLQGGNILKEKDKEGENDEGCGKCRRHKSSFNNSQSEGYTLSPSVYAIDNRRQVGRLHLERSLSVGTSQALDKIRQGERRKRAKPDKQAAATMLQQFSTINLKALSAVASSSEAFSSTGAYFSSVKFASDLCAICKYVSSIFENEDRVLTLQSPVHIVGDIHGNLQDLNLFSKNIWPLGMELTAGNILFLGDYVDRGQFGLEICAYLFAYKLLLPDKLFLIRGNHETRNINGWTERYGTGSFLFQCRTRFGPDEGNRVWQAVNDVFDRLPLASVIDKKVFCVHGGVPRVQKQVQEKSETSNAVADTRMESIQNMPCPAMLVPPLETETDMSVRLALDLLWADPASEQEEMSGIVSNITGFGKSERGGDMICFGMQAINEFLDTYQFSHIIRAHQANPHGITISKSARVITVFSTSKDHGCGPSATCGCVLVDKGKIFPFVTKHKGFSRDSSM